MMSPHLKCDNLFNIYHILVPLPAAKIRFYFHIINHSNHFQMNGKSLQKNVKHAGTALQKKTKNNLSSYSCEYLSVIGLVSRIFPLQCHRHRCTYTDGRHLCFDGGTKNNIAGTKNDVSDNIVFCCRVIVLINAQVCDKRLYPSARKNVMKNKTWWY